MKTKYVKFTRGAPEGLKLLNHFWVECQIDDNTYFDEVSQRSPNHIVLKPGGVARYPLNHLLINSLMGADVEFTESSDKVKSENLNSAKKLYENHFNWMIKTIDSFPFTIESRIEDIDAIEFMKVFSRISPSEPYLDNEYDLRYVMGET